MAIELEESNSRYVVILNRYKEIDIYEVNHYEYPDTALTDDRFETEKEALDAANKILNDCSNLIALRSNASHQVLLAALKEKLEKMKTNLENAKE